MNELSQQKCVACRGGDPALTEPEIAELQPQIPEWQIKEVDGIKRLERVFKFKNFVQALEFTNKVGAIAEEEDHHPLIITEWGRVTLYCPTPYQIFGNPGYQYVQWWTHVIKGLHKNDFVMAAKTDKIYG